MILQYLLIYKNYIVCFNPNKNFKKRTTQKQVDLKPLPPQRKHHQFARSFASSFLGYGEVFLFG